MWASAAAWAAGVLCSQPHCPSASCICAPSSLCSAVIALNFSTTPPHSQQELLSSFSLLWNQVSDLGMSSSTISHDTLPFWWIPHCLSGGVIHQKGYVYLSMDSGKAMSTAISTLALLAAACIMLAIFHLSMDSVWFCKILFYKWSSKEAALLLYCLSPSGIYAKKTTSVRWHILLILCQFAYICIFMHILDWFAYFIPTQLLDRIDLTSASWGGQ